MTFILRIVTAGTICYGFNSLVQILLNVVDFISLQLMFSSRLGGTGGTNLPKLNFYFDSAKKKH